MAKKQKSTQQPSREVTGQRGKRTWDTPSSPITPTDMPAKPADTPAQPEPQPMQPTQPAQPEPQPTQPTQPAQPESKPQSSPKKD